MQETRFIVAMLLLLFHFSLRAQVSDAFTDGDFSADPAWQGDDSLFIVNSLHQLQSNGTAGSSKDLSLSTPLLLADSMEWQCWVKFNLSPSNANFCRFYLSADQPDLKGGLNGYYIQFGGVTGNTDSITLYKQKGMGRTRIIAGRPATVSRNSNTVRIRVRRDAGGNWSLWSDTLGGRHFEVEGNGYDHEFAIAGSCGVFVRFTSGNIHNYFLDDVYAGAYVIDRTPPSLDSLKVLNSTQLRLVFSEELEATAALDATHYSIGNSIGNASQVAFDAGRNDAVIVTFPTPFTSGTTYLLSTGGIADAAGNVLALQTRSFLYVIPSMEDVLISEFMPDPSPAVGLPEQEFIELYNRSIYPLNLEGWTLSDGSTTAVFPSVTIQPDSFLLTCASSHANVFAAYGKTAALTSFPSLNNTGDLIILKDAQGNIIHQLSYDMSWYDDPAKTDGGWSIELRNPRQLCKGRSNYAASVHPAGGTPGTANSNWNTARDTIAPQLSYAGATSVNTAVLLFNEKMDSLSLLNATISVTPSLSLLSRSVSGELHDSLTLTWSANYTSAVTYTISIQGARDCSQQPIDTTACSQHFIYYIPDTAHAFDIVIHELLADPDPSAGLPPYEFIELYNRSPRIISLKGWSLGDGTSQAWLPDRLLLPDSFIIVTGSAAKDWYKPYGATAAVVNFPSLGNDGDELVLKNEKGLVMHALHYTSSWYGDAVKANGGWSLEMIDPRNPCTGKDNWSPSKNSKGGTPGRPNTVHTANPDVAPPKLLRSYPLGSHDLVLFFSEPLDSTSISTASAQVNGLGAISTVTLQAPLYSAFTAHFTDSFQPRLVYRVLSQGLRDCAGNLVSDADYSDFGIAEPIDSGDLVINEVLFNPRINGVDFVELYNRSDKVIDLRSLFIANANTDQSIRDLYPAAAGGFLLFPHEYCALTEQPDVLEQQYFSPNTKNFLPCSMPAYADDAGTVVLLDAQGMRYDRFSYDEHQHFPLLDDKEGVSLERIDFNRPAADASNWTSAATGVLATPAYRNSQYAHAGSKGVSLSIEPEVFTPDDDGQKDVVNFSYSFEESGYMGNLFIYDARGNQVKHLLRNEVLGTHGTHSWNGITDKSEKAPIGIYVVYFEVFNLKGEVNKYRSTVVVGAKM